MSSAKENLFLVVVLVVLVVMGFFSFRDFIRAEYKDIVPTGLRWRLLWLLALVGIIGIVRSFFVGD